MEEKKHAVSYDAASAVKNAWESVVRWEDGLITNYQAREAVVFNLCSALEIFVGTKEHTKALSDVFETIMENPDWPGGE